MSKKEIKFIILISCLVVLLLWFFPTASYNFSSDVSSQIKENILESIPNVYHLIFGGEKGNVEIPKLSGAGWIFVMHLGLLFVCLVGLDEDENGLIDALVIGLSFFLCSSFFTKASSYLGTVNNDYFTSGPGISVWGTIVLYIIIFIAIKLSPYV